MNGRTIFFKVGLIGYLSGFLMICPAAAQVTDPYHYADPFIGTTQSAVPTKWGSEGGTYPGAVAPWGYLQLSPETKMGGGYDYRDSAIRFFSCLGHYSGFPGGSAGRLQVMPVAGADSFAPKTYTRPFSHRNEAAEPGYYRILFPDNHTLVEATAAARAGMFRFTFPYGVLPRLYVGGDPELQPDGSTVLRDTAHGILIRFSDDYVEKIDLPGGCLLRFRASPDDATIVELSVSASPVGVAAAKRNIAGELSGGFDAVRARTRRVWTKALSVVEIGGAGEADKRSFYTALYHSLLLPWVISDVDGYYRGADRQVHHTAGGAEYGGFSPWDTFRSLDPLLCLLFPEKQSDMIRSMLDVYRQTGHLPTESMTGNHSVPIIVDACLKGVPGIDRDRAFAAMQKSIARAPFAQPDMPVFLGQGYIPFSWPESVTRTVEYAYDAWALAHFSQTVFHRPDSLLLQRSYAYRLLFDPAERLLLPRKGDLFKRQPGNSGYKEGDKWVYSWFVPHDPQGLVNLMGGPDAFSERLDSLFADGRVLFDNETVIETPYLFNAAGHPALTQKWVRAILQKRFADSPGGLPGNDDLGSMSSWYVFSALGIFPLCPGRPWYTLGSPLFGRARIHLSNGQTFVIRSTHAAPENVYVQSVSIDHKRYNSLAIPHSLLLQGGEMVFEMGPQPAAGRPGEKTPLVFSETRESPDFHLLHCFVSKRAVEPNELFQVHFSLQNKGSLGTRRVALLVGGKVYAYKNVLLKKGRTVTDSMPCRLYPYGPATLQIDGLPPVSMTVVRPRHPVSDKPAITRLGIRPVLKAGEIQPVSYDVQNSGGDSGRFQIDTYLNDTSVQTMSLRLAPGEESRVYVPVTVAREGLQKISVGDREAVFKVYRKSRDALVLDLPLNGAPVDGEVPDRSGFGNNAHIIRDSAVAGKGYSDGILLDKDRYIEVPAAPSLDRMGATITMMAWVYPMEQKGGLTDLFTKGDYHVLQVVDGKALSFFAGGWGRGDCTVPLPANWKDHWHHIAGVCDGHSLQLYIDGELKGSTLLGDTVNLSVSNHWVLGRNEEFPGQRIFKGYMKGVKVFAAPLSAEEIGEEMR